MNWLIEYFDDKMEAAVMAFQKDKGLTDEAAHENELRLPA